MKNVAESCKCPIIFEELERQNLSARDFATQIGVSAGNISDWKSGRSAPSAKAWNKASEVLGCTVEYLKTGKKNNPATAQDARQRELVVLARRAEQIPDEDYKRIVKTFEDTIDIYLRARGLDPDDYR